MMPDAPAESRLWGRAVAVFLLSWVVFTWPWLIGDFTIPGESKNLYYPNLLFLAQSWFSGESAFWNPYNFTGHPQIADPASLIFSPYALLALLDSNPGTRAFDALTFILLGLGGTAMIFFARLNHWHWLSGALAAVIFAFGGTAMWRISDTGQILCFSFMPLAFLYLEFTLRRKSLIYGLITGLMLGMMVMTRNHLALLALYVFFARVLWFWLSLPLRRQRFSRTLIPVLACVIVCSATSCLPLLFTNSLLQMSGLPDAELASAARFSLHPAHLLTYFTPNLFSSAGEAVNFWGPPSVTWPDTGLALQPNMVVLYMGALPLLLLGFVFYPSFWRARSILFCFVAFSFSALYSLGAHAPLFSAVFNYLPGAKFFARPADGAFLLGILGSLISGYMLNYFFNFRSNPAILFLSGSVMLLGVFWLSWMTAQEYGQMISASPSLLLSAVTFAIGTFVLLFAHSVIRAWPQLTAVVLILFVLVDLRLNNGPNTYNAAPRDNYRLLDSYNNDDIFTFLQRELSKKQLNVIDRVDLSGLGLLWSNAASVHRIPNALGYNPLQLSWVSETLGTKGGVRDKTRSFVPTFPSYSSPLAQTLGLRFVATSETLTQPEGLVHFIEVKRSDEQIIYETRSAYPRLWLTENAYPLTNRKEILEQGFPDLNFLNDVLLEEPPSNLPRFRRTGVITLRLYRHNEIEIETRRSEGGYLVLADAWHPWWRATIDNRTTKIYRANLMMRAVIIPPGSHVIRFHFDPLCGLMHEFNLYKDCKF